MPAAGLLDCGELALVVHLCPEFIDRGETFCSSQVTEDVGDNWRIWTTASLSQIGERCAFIQVADVTRFLDTRHFLLIKSVDQATLPLVLSGPCRSLCPRKFLLERPRSHAILVSVSPMWPMAKPWQCGSSLVSRDTCDKRVGESSLLRWSLKLNENGLQLEVDDPTSLVPAPMFM